MAKKALRDIENFTYVLAEDRTLPAEEQSVFKLRPLTQAERMKVLDGMEVVRIEGNGDRSIKPCGMQQAYDAALSTIVSIENFPAGAPEAYPIEKGRAACARFLEQLSDNALYEIGMYVIDRSTLGPPEKNSSTP